MVFGSRSRRGGRLPVELTSFVGRTAELADVHRLLRATRMVTLVGPGGVGKTRLALRASAQAADGYPDGAHLAELSGLKGAALLPNAVSEALGLPEQSGRPQVDAVVEYVAGRELLLILDTCEHLLDACALLADLLLPQAPRLTILATSRQALDVPGEHVLPVAPLPLPDEQGQEGGEALTLFAQRAAAVVPGFTLSGSNRAQAAALCRRLDGIPLAIELAAVRLRALPLDELVARLADTFALLSGGRMTTLPRHQTLRTAIGWSHELCTPQERLLWARLSVFAGSFDLAAVEAVCTDAELPARQVLEHLIGLVDKSVVLRDGGQGTRYRLLDTLREYGAEWLESLGETGAARHRHVAHYRSLLRHFEERFATSEEMPLYRALEPEQENLRVALEYALGDGAGLGLTAVMWPYWMCSGQPIEACFWMEQALGQQPEPTPDRVTTLCWTATFAAFQGDRASARSIAQEAQDAAGRVGDRRLLAYAVLARGISLTYGGEHAAGMVLLREARESMRALGDAVGLRLATMRLAISHTMAREPEEALAAFDETLALVGEGSEGTYIEGYVNSGASIAHLIRGDAAAAVRSARRAVVLHHARADVLGVALTLSVLAWLATGEGRHRRAAWLFGAAEALWALVAKEPLIGNPVLQAMQARYEQAACEALGEQGYGQLHRQGARLTGAQAVELAAGDLDSLPAAVAPSPPAGSRTDALTRREREVAALVAKGMSNREIAEQLVISKRTADAHVEHILAKLGFSSRSEIVALLAGEEGSQPQRR